MDKQNDLPFETVAKLRAEFSESNLPILVDILSWNDIPDSFKDEFNKKHEVLVF